MDIQEKFHHRLNSVEERISRLRNNSAPTLPIYQVTSSGPTISGYIIAQADFTTPFNLVYNNPTFVHYDNFTNNIAIAPANSWIQAQVIADRPFRVNNSTYQITHEAGTNLLYNEDFIAEWGASGDSETGDTRATNFGNLGTNGWPHLDLSDISLAGPFGLGDAYQLSWFNSLVASGADGMTFGNRSVIVYAIVADPNFAIYGDGSTYQAFEWNSDFSGAFDDTVVQPGFGTDVSLAFSNFTDVGVNQWLTATVVWDDTSIDFTPEPGWQTIIQYQSVSTGYRTIKLGKFITGGTVDPLTFTGTFASAVHWTVDLTTFVTV